MVKSMVATILRILRQCQGHQHQHPTLTLQLGQGITREMHSEIHLPGKPCLSGLNFSFSCKIQSLGISKHAWFSSISCRQKRRWRWLLCFQSMVGFQLFLDLLPAKAAVAVVAVPPRSSVDSRPAATCFVKLFCFIAL